MKFKSTSTSILLIILTIVLVIPLNAELKLEIRQPTRNDIERLKELEGVYQEGVNYNQKIQGFGTGLKPPTEEEWERLLQTGRIALSRSITTVAPSSFDNSSFKWFPPIGNQGIEGSCVSWATGYYVKTFQEAYEHDWDLSGCSWQSRGYGGYYGYPSTSYQDKIFSPDFIYHQVNDGEDNGSYYSDNMDLLENIGCATWKEMPYYQLDSNPYDSHCGDSTSWPSEAAWREAPLYRSKTGYTYQWVDGTFGTINDLKDIISNTKLAVISINANKFSSLDVNDLWTTDSYTSTSRNHANTVVGYDDSYGPYTEDGATKYGAFKVANSWGTGGWENVSDGFYWISYAVMQQYVQYVYYFENENNYNPHRLAILEISHNKRGECDIEFGSGTIGSPTGLKKLNYNHILNGGNWPFPTNKIVVDISELPSSTNFFLKVPDDGSGTTGSITSFAIETYTGTYSPGSPSNTYVSTSTPLSTTNGSTVYATLSTSTSNVPVVSTIPGEVINEDGTFVTIALDNYVSDADHSDSQISWTYSGNTDLAVSISGSRVATITAPANWNGSESITFIATDPSSATDNSTATFSVNPVNDQPSFTKGSNQSILENAGHQHISAWASNMSVGPSGESGYQVFNFYTSNNNNTLFSTPPYVSYPSGDLNYQVNPGMYGTAVCTVYAQDDGGTVNGGDDTSPIQTFTISVTNINNPPGFTKGSNQIINEDAGAQIVIGWATNITAGSYESAQSLSFDVTNDNNGLFLTQPTVNPTTGNLTYEPAANTSGITIVSVTLQDNGGTANGGNDTSPTKDFTITVNPVNDPPTFTKGVDQSIMENSSPQTVPGWATNISAGLNESGQSIVFHVSNDNNSLFAAQPSLNSNGDLSYEVKADSSGMTALTVYLSDDGGTDNGGINESAHETFTITVNDINDAPSFTKGTNQEVNEDTGIQTISNWATNISAGPNESSQTLSFIATNDNNGLFSTQPSINSTTGSLTFEPASNVYGTATVSITLKDDGGTVNGGVDTSPTEDFTITINPVNDPPIFSKGTNQSIMENSGTQTVPGWATNISAGPNESGQNVVFHVNNDNNSLFSVQPSVSSNGDLTYETNSDSSGLAIVTIYLFDDGGTADGGINESAHETFMITVNDVNDAPSFAKGINQEINEDAGLQTIPGWATSMNAGPGESHQNVTFITNNDNQSMFKIQPTINANTGNLTFETKSNYYGSTNVTIYLQDDGGTANGGNDTSPIENFIITINPVNDSPSFTKGIDQLVTENSGLQTVSGWASNIDPGQYESGQALTFHTSNDNNSLFESQPQINSNGVLSYGIKSDSTGSATVLVYLTDDGGTENGGIDQSATKSFTVTVTDVNDPPTFTKGSDQIIIEDAGMQTVVGWVSDLNPGPGESHQSLTFHTTNDNNSLFLFQPTIDETTGDLTFETQPDSNGTSTITVYLTDDGGTTNGGDDQSDSETFTITVQPVNDPPTFTKGTNQTVAESSGSQTVAGWAMNINAGPNESDQTVTFTVTNDNNSLFAAQPSVNSNGDLTFEAKTDSTDSATVTVYLTDDGGTANGGIDQSGVETFTISISPVNNSPSFTKGDTQLIIEDAGAHTVIGWANDINAGPGESHQSLAFHTTNDNNSLFLSQPIIDEVTGNLTYESQPDSNGTATVTVYLTDDGGTGNAGDDQSDSEIFTITVQPVNDPPTFTKGSDQTVIESSDAQTIAAWATNINIGPGEIGQTSTFYVTNDNPTLFKSQPTINALTGDLSFTPQTDSTGMALISVSMTDDGGTENGGIDHSDTATFMIIVSPVNNPPSFTKGSDQTIDEDVGPQTITNWANNISPGPGESHQIVTFTVTNDNNALFSSQPEIDANSGDLTFKSASDSNGIVNVTVFITDNGGTDNGGIDHSDTANFMITITPVNDAPVFTHFLPSDTTIGNNVYFEYQFTAEDIENNELTYFSKSSIDGFLVSNLGLASWELASDPEESYSLIIGVTDGTDTTTTTSIIYVEDVVSIEDESLLPSEFVLNDAYPNPFNPHTTISYALPTRSYVYLCIYNLAGKIVHEKRFVNQDIGNHKYQWNAAHMPSGVYFYRLSTNSNHSIKKCVLLK